jgi:hypothetical protein
MPDIRYICLSDTHLGADASILTSLDGGRVDPTRPSKPLVCLAECLRSLVAGNEGREKPALVLNGDVLELALATTSVAVMTFRRALEQLLPRGETPFVSRLVYLPGNHDHHVWEAAREQRYCTEIAQPALGGAFPNVRHTTPLLGAAPMRSALLDAVMQGLDPARTVPVDVLYPNLALRSEDAQRLLIFHHGHFLEPIYSAMSRLQGALFPGTPPPTTVEELEADNGAWIDFFWSALGNSGDVGPDVELLYEKLQSPEQVQGLLANLARALARQNKNAVLSGLESFAFTHLLLPVAMPLLDFFRSQTTQELSQEEQQGLVQYLSGPLRNQILSELGEHPPSMTFAFGHTHRAFAREIDVPALGRSLRVFNTGGWVVDSREVQPLNGASVLLVDEDLEVVGIRLYTETDRLDDYHVSVFGLPGPNGQPGPFQRRVTELVQRSPALWTAFSRAAGPAVAERRALLGENIRRAG